MKKVALTLASVMAAAAFAPEASAVPAFARQTGMACSACHQQHFPVLNSFGRAFKADGFTMMGAQALVEGEHLSLPSVLNTGILLKAQYRKTNGANAIYLDGTDTVSTNDGAWLVPDEFGLFFGGRLTESGNLKVGTMIEHNMADLVGFRIPVVFDAGVKLSAIPFLTDSLGPFYGYTESGTGLNRAVRWNEHHADISAHRYVGFATGAASGLTLMAKADAGYVAVSRWTPNFPMSNQTLSLTLVHAAWTPTIAGWDMVVSAESTSGTSKTANTTTHVWDNGDDYNAMGMTVQAHGELAGMASGLYVTYANAPKSSASTVNSYNTSTANDKSAYTFGGEVSVVPHVLHLGAAYRGGNTNAGKSDNAITLAATYDLAQNLALQLTHSMYSGTKYDTAQAKGTAQTSMLLEAAW